MDCTVRRPCVEADFDWAQLAGAACISRPLDEIPQGLKPRLLSAPSGTTEAGPCKSRLLQPVLELFEVGEFLHQLLHAVPREHHGELGVFAVAFAHQDRALRHICCGGRARPFSGRRHRWIRVYPSSGAMGRAKAGFALPLPPKKRAMLSIEPLRRVRAFLDLGSRRALRRGKPGASWLSSS